jgi:hypothetical protein
MMRSKAPRNMIAATPTVSGLGGDAAAYQWMGGATDHQSVKSVLQLLLHFYFSQQVRRSSSTVSHQQQQHASQLEILL